MVGSAVGTLRPDQLDPRMWMAPRQEPLEHVGVYGVAEIGLGGTPAPLHTRSLRRVRVVIANRGAGRKTGELDVLRM